MSKGIFTKLLFFTGFLAAAVIWLIKVILPDDSFLSGYNWSWAALIACAGVFLCFLLRGLFGGKYKSVNVTYKKFNLLLAAAAGVIIVLLIVNLAVIKDKLALPLIALVVAVALVLMILVTGGKKWDQADNQKPGYKTYAEREAEKEKQERK